MKQIIDQLAEQFGMTKKEGKEIVDFIFDQILENTKSEGSIKLPIGTFLIAEKAERNGVNPKTQEKIKIPAKQVFKLKIPKSIQNILQK